MTTAINENQNFDIKIDLINFKYKLNKSATLKGLTALVGLVIGVVALIFLSIHFAPLAIGGIIVASYSFYHQIQNCLDANRDFGRETSALALNPPEK
jgi:hypothetical protein